MFRDFVRLKLLFILLGSVFLQPVFGQKYKSTEAIKVMDSLSDQAVRWQVKNDSLSAQYASKMLALAKQESNSSKQGEALFLLANAYQGISSYKALDYFNEATPFLEATNHELLGSLYFRKSNLCTYFSEFPSALQNAFQSLEYNTIKNNKQFVQRDMSFIGYIHDRMYEFSESIKWNRKALQLAIELGDKKAQALCYSRIGIAFDELAEKDNFNKKLFDSALYYNKKSAKLSEQVNALSQARTTYSNLGNTYSKLKNYKQAEAYTLKSLAVPGFEQFKGVTLVNLGKIYLETGRYQEAKKILDSAMKNTKKYGTRKYQLEAYYRFHELHVKQGKYQSALAYFKKYKNIEDSLLNENKNKQIVEVRERYQTAEKERKILTQRAELAEQNIFIQKRNYQLIGLITLVVLVALLGYLLYSRQQLKNKQLQKENELKSALTKIEMQNKLQEQRLRISRDLHDNIGSQLTFIISSIDNLKYKFKINDANFNNNINSISSFTKSTIGELRDTIWAMNKHQITFSDLRVRISNFIEQAQVASQGISFRFIVSPTLSQKSLSSIKGMNLYRIIQEALNNAIKHASANKIEVSIQEKKEKLSIIISDNGIGFNPEKTNTSNGLRNIKKRANDMQAHLEINSKANQGTTITILV